LAICPQSNLRFRSTAEHATHAEAETSSQSSLCGVGLVSPRPSEQLLGAIVRGFLGLTPQPTHAMRRSAQFNFSHAHGLREPSQLAPEIPEGVAAGPPLLRGPATNSQQGSRRQSNSDSRTTGLPLPSSANVNQCKFAIIGASANLNTFKFALLKHLQK